MEFPTTVYRISLSSRGSDDSIPVTITAIPARMTNQLVITANGRRLKLNQLETMDFIASSDTLMIIHLHTLSEQDIPALIEQMLASMKKDVAKRLALLTKLQIGLNSNIVVKKRDWEQ